MIHPPFLRPGKKDIPTRTALASEILRYHHQRLSCHHILQTAKYVLNDYIKNFFGLFADNCLGDDEEGSSAQLRDCSKSNCVMNFFPTTLAHFFEIFNHHQEITTLKY